MNVYVNSYERWFSNFIFHNKYTLVKLENLKTFLEKTSFFLYIETFRQKINAFAIHNRKT